MVIRRHVARREVVDLKRIDDDDRQADGADCAEQQRETQQRPGFSFHHVL